jgi:ornithine cyclodeaminase/alanine dehydrogenase-like protein (mu-crystallin family)
MAASLATLNASECQTFKVIYLADAANGLPLALMDSIYITKNRTAAATAVAAKYLARPDSQVVTICGCGTQGRIQLEIVVRTRESLYGSRVKRIGNITKRTRAAAYTCVHSLKTPNSTSKAPPVYPVRLNNHRGLSLRELTRLLNGCH